MTASAPTCASCRQASWPDPATGKCARCGGPFYAYAAPAKTDSRRSAIVLTAAAGVAAVALVAVLLSRQGAPAPIAAAPGSPSAAPAAAATSPSPHSTTAAQPPTLKPQPTPTTQPPTQEPTAQPTESPAPHVSMKGSGSRVARFSWPESEPALITMTYRGSDNFIVIPLASDGEELSSVANVIGSWHGRVLLMEQSVALKVETNGTWTISIDVVTRARTWSGTGVLRGSSADVVIVRPGTTGLTTWRISHRGRENVIVDVLDTSGMDNIVNEIGVWTGEVAVPDGTVLITVDADGAWTVTPTG